MQIYLCIIMQTGANLRTTLELDRDLLERAKGALGSSSYTEAIETALRDAVARVDARAGWDALIGSERSWEGVEEFLDFRRRHGSRTLG